MKKRKLSPKQHKFVDRYLVLGNATKAAELAGYAKNSAKVTGARLLTNANISKIIRDRQQKAENKADVTMEWWLKEVKHLVDKAEKDSDKAKGLEMLGKHLGAYKENNRFALDVDNMGDMEINAIAAILIKNLK